MIQNIRLINPNVTRIDGYFYSFDEETDAMIQKTDDGTLAFAYPLDSPISSQVTSLEYDGESFWTMENIDGTPANGFRIRRWVISNFVMVLQQTFTFATDSQDTFESEAFTIEQYEGDVTSGATENTSTLTVDFPSSVFALLTPGTNIFLGPSTKAGFEGETERATVASTGPGTTVTLSAPLSSGYSTTDTVVFSKNIWFFNQHYLKETDAGGLYKAAIADGSILSRTKGGAYKDINAAGFVDLTGTFSGSLTVHNKPSFLVFIRTNSLLFIDVLDSNLTTELSSIQNNLSPDTTEVYDVEDMAFEGDTIFRLQTKFNINGTETNESTFNYQLATFNPFPTAIALTADPAILPADNSSTSLITATVTDQYALPFVKTPAATIQMTATQGTLSTTGFQSLDGNGQATNTYTADTTAGLVTITAEVNI